MIIITQVQDVIQLHYKNVVIMQGKNVICPSPMNNLCSCASNRIPLPWNRSLMGKIRCKFFLNVFRTPHFLPGNEGTGLND